MRQPLNLRPSEDAAREVVEVEELAAEHGAAAVRARVTVAQQREVSLAVLLVLTAETSLGCAEAHHAGTGHGGESALAPAAPHRPRPCSHRLTVAATTIPT